ncbi:MAG: polysaccharide biosynthesis/export family protein [Terriglobia bacterium]
MVAVLGAALVLPAQERVSPLQPETPQSVPALGANRPDFVIAPDDELSVNIVDVPEISGEFRVSPSGTITLPLISHPIAASGLTLAQLSEAIRRSLQQAGMVSDPHVNVQVKQSPAHSIAIVGAVNKPQVYPVFGEISLLDAISQAGGLSPDAGTTAIVTRGNVAARALGIGPRGDSLNSGASRTVKVDLGALMRDGRGAADIELYPGDSVTVDHAGIVYVIGAVKRAGGFALTDGEQITVLQALALAEYTTTTAMPQKAAIIRKSPGTPGGTTEIPVDIKKILARRAPDRTLMASDVLFVPDSTTKRVLHRAGEAAAEAASLFVYRVP